MKFRHSAILILILLAAQILCAANPVDSAEFSRLPWVRQLIAANFDVNHPGINYPKFARFCVNVYNWGDKTFNDYDSAYVVGTGKKWKAMARSYNWITGNEMFFSSRNYLRIRSNLYSDLGAHISFMAVSTGYTWDANAIFGGETSVRRSFNFNFVCGLFSAGINYSKANGGTKITHFGDYRPADGHSLDYKFNDISQETMSANIYYFFNHRKYSQGAAYNFSRYQLRSAGTWMVGFSYDRQKIGMNFSGLPSDMLEYLPKLETDYHFFYRDYDVLAGYGYNWVLKPRTWLINATVLPSVGYKHSYEGTTDGKKDMFSANIRVYGSVVYNHRCLFAAVIGNFEGHSYFARGFTFFNSIPSVSIVTGVRF
ncbi:MAG: DUF4421 domain-containing protein [Paramuribaculum sp.]|nr:DUF4421 domain-containing protein [Paramuribaculum sp.]